MFNSSKSKAELDLLRTVPMQLLVHNPEDFVLGYGGALFDKKNSLVIKRNYLYDNKDQITGPNGKPMGRRYDVFDYLQKKRGMSLPEAKAYLRQFVDEGALAKFEEIYGD